MIIAVSGVIKTNNNNNYSDNNNSQYQQKFYQKTTKTILKRQVKNDFEDILTCEMSKLKINILI